MRTQLITVCFLFVSGCGSYFPPSPTTRAVKISDLAGTWVYGPLGEKDNVTLVLNADGTFDQTVITSSQTLSQSGTWAIDGSNIEFDSILVEFRGWNAGGALWRIIDRNESPTGFAILGGAEDPDQWVVLRWIYQSGAGQLGRPGILPGNQ